MDVNLATAGPSEGPAERLLRRFPKTRPPLPPAFQAIYAAQYKENRSGETAAASLSQRLESWMHRKVAADVRGGRARPTLELGAGTLNQLPYEPEGAPYDVVEPFTALLEDAPAKARVRDVFADLREVPAERRYDRITSVAALEHIADLPFVLARSARLLAPGGVFRAAIPAEGGFLWRMGWSLTTGLEFRLRHGLDYGVLMRHEHVNTAAEIEGLARLLFAETRVDSFGLGRQLSLYRFIEARAPRLDVAAAWEARFPA
ncbi:MAG: class I SAM-dependent methyltransferase [Phenylobacterium sp.]|uniref:class I SAM-dependent methyltransferase n=1 Tax=Phenylobacterium sp. TaxID=1871053 RepID=UPI00391D853F